MSYLTISFLLGIFSCQFSFGIMPSIFIYIASLLLAIFSYFLKNKLLISSLAFLLGFAYAQYSIQDALEVRKYKIITYKTVLATGKIASIPNCIAETCKFKFLIENIILSKQDKIYYGISSVTWRGAPVGIGVGQEWKLLLKLKSPHAAANPGSFNLEKFYLTQKITTIGSVIGKSPQINKLISDNIFIYPINRIRQYLISKVQNNLVNAEFNQFILALTLGVRNNISPMQNAVLQNTGTSHLMAISGLHIGFVALLALYVVNVTSRFFIAQLSVAPYKLAAVVAIIFSVIYSVLSGLQIPALRAIVMITVYMLGKIFTRSITGWQSFYFSLLVVLLVDPLAVYSAGFWMSFVAVFVLLYTAPNNLTKNNWLVSMLKMQFILLIGLLPLSVSYFAKISLISPLANLISVPIVSFWVVPLAIIGVVMQVFSDCLSGYLLNLAHFGFSLVWMILKYLADLPRVQLNFFQLDYLSMLLACIGSIWVLSPRGIPRKYMGVLCFLPIFFPAKPNIPDGEFVFTLLDVGQGLATVIQTKNHVILYDTGLKYSDNIDSGTNIILPFLSMQRIKNIDLMIISHPDLDHFGGARSIVQNTLGVKTTKLIINDITAVDNTKFKNIAIQHCQAGQSWQWDGVDFMVLHPQTNLVGSKNEYSCVLKITNSAGSILLPGDIGEKTEKQLVDLYADRLKADVLVVPHHGSKYSSSQIFLDYVQPKLALISAGYLNRYKHPSIETYTRLQKAKIGILTTEECGAISLVFAGQRQLQPDCYRLINILKF